LCELSRDQRHRSANARVGPDLTHFASRRQLGAGIADNTPENLRRWLANPQQVKPGVKMPDFKFTDEQVTQLVDYIETLK
jgi:cytochrome c oxidase subunit II